MGFSAPIFPPTRHVLANKGAKPCRSLGNSARITAHIIANIIAFAAAFIMTVRPAAAVAVSDDFSDLNDTANPTWAHLNGLVASTGQTWDASTGQYRMTASNNGFSNLAWVGSYVSEPFTDVVVTADIVSFIDDPTAQGAPFGVAARLDGNNAFNSLKGYAYAYEPHAAGGLGEAVHYRINGASFADLGASRSRSTRTKTTASS